MSPKQDITQTVPLNCVASLTNIALIQLVNRRSWCAINFQCSGSSIVLACKFSLYRHRNSHFEAVTLKWLGSYSLGGGGSSPLNSPKIEEGREHEALYINPRVSL